MRKFLCLFFLLAPLTFASEVATAVHGLEQRYNHAHTLKATFYEQYSDGSGGITGESGTVYFSRPGRMRWEYESPEEKLFLVDGPNVWFYVPADHTASRAKLKESSDWRTPLALLVGNTNLSRLCDRIKIAANPKTSSGQELKLLAPSDTMLACTPRGSKGDEQVLLETDPENRLVRVVIDQAGNATTEFRFGNWQENIAIPEVKFHFQPPPGVAIVDDQSLPGDIH